MSLPATAPKGPAHSPVPTIPPPDDPIPGGRLPDEQPEIGPLGPRTPYPVNDPGLSDPRGPGSEPDYLPGQPSDPGTRF